MTRVLPHACSAAILALSAVLGACASTSTSDTNKDTASATGIAYPIDYRRWYHVKSRINGPTHSAAANVGFQHVYANDQALAGLRSGHYADGAIIVLDRIALQDSDNNVTNEAARKVLLVMMKNQQRYASTGGWGFEAFKGGDRAQRIVQDGGAQCFACHAPLAKDQFVFSTLRD